MTTAALTQRTELLRPKTGKSRKDKTPPRRAAKTEARREPFSWRSLIPGLASAVLSAQLILIMVAVFSSLAVNGPTVVVIGGSMEPNVPKGSVLVAKLPEPGSIKEGTIVVFEGDNGTVTHRVVAASGEGEYITRGDNNGQDDSTPLTADRIKGQARLIVPWIGWPRVWWQESNHVALGAWGAFLLLLVWVSGMSQRKRPTRSEVDESEDAADSSDTDLDEDSDEDSGDELDEESDTETTLKRHTRTHVETDNETTLKRTPQAAPEPHPVLVPLAPSSALGSAPSHRCHQPRRTVAHNTHRVVWTPPHTMGTARLEDRVPRRAVM